MFFCDECRYLFNISKDVKSKQVGGKIEVSLDNIFNKFFRNEKIINEDLSRITKKDVMNDERFEKSSKKDQKKLISQIKNADKNFFSGGEDDMINQVGTNKAYFVCRFCKNYKQIKPRTLIYSKNLNTSNIMEVDDYTYAIHDHTLARTKNYICKNSKCETHKNSSIKEAVLTKNSIDQLVYVCVVCSTWWINGI